MAKRQLLLTGFLKTSGDSEAKRQRVCGNKDAREPQPIEVAVDLGSVNEPSETGGGRTISGPSRPPAAAVSSASASTANVSTSEEEDSRDGEDDDSDLKPESGEIWKKAQFKIKKTYYPWLIQKNGCLGCSTCNNIE